MEKEMEKSLNRDCLWLVASWLEFEDLLTWRRVNRAAAEWILNYLNHRGAWSHSVNGPPLQRLMTEQLATKDILANPQLTHLYMGVYVQDKELPFWQDDFILPPQITQLTNLTSLKISIPTFDSWVYSLPNLQKLILQTTRRTNLEEWEKVPPIASLSGLRSLHLLEMRVQDSDLVPLTRLRKLYLSTNRLLTGVGLSGLTQLTSLTLKRQTPNFQWSILSSLGQLTDLCLDWNSLRDADLESVRTLPSLQSLSLNYCREVTEQGLRGFTGLTELQLMGDRIALVSLATLGTLSSLCISLEWLTPGVLSQLTQLESLRTELRGASTVDLSILPSLRTLGLYYQVPRHQMTYPMLDLHQLLIHSLYTDYPISDLSLLPPTLRRLQGFPVSPSIHAQLEARGVILLPI